MSQRLFQKRLFPIVSLLLFLLFFLCSAWWYGLFSDIGKENHKIDGLDILLLTEDTPKELQKTCTILSTRTLVKLLCGWGSFNPVYDYPKELYLKFLNEQSFDFPSIVTSELFKRNNSAKILLNVYSELPIQSKNIPNSNLIGILELMLSYPQIQNHLTPEDKQFLDEVIYQKQWEKFYSLDYSDFKYYNFLFTDAYNHNGWNEEKLEQYAEPFQHLLTEKGRTEPKEVHFSKRHQQKVLSEIRENTHSRWARFDDCQITQP